MTYEERQREVCNSCTKHANCTYVECRRTDLCLDLDNIMRGWELGQQDAKEQMMREAVEKEVYADEYGCPYVHVDAGLKWFDRVKVIIIKTSD